MKPFCNGAYVHAYACVLTVAFRRLSLQLNAITLDDMGEDVGYPAEQWYHFTTPGNSSYMLKCSYAQFISLLDPYITDESHANTVLDPPVIRSTTHAIL